MKELRQQLVSALLVIVTVAAVVAGRDQPSANRPIHLPDRWGDVARPEPSDQQKLDGVAVYIARKSRRKAGIHKATVWFDRDLIIQRALDVTAVAGAPRLRRKVEYRSCTTASRSRATLLLARRARFHPFFIIRGCGGLSCIGLFVYFGGEALRAHCNLFILCVTSFVLFTFHLPGKLNNFDKWCTWETWWQDSWLQRSSCILLRCFPEPQRWIRPKGVALALYFAGLALRAFTWASCMAGDHGRSMLEMRWLLDRVWLGFLSPMYLAGASRADLATGHHTTRCTPPIDLAPPTAPSRVSSPRCDLRGALLNGRSSHHAMNLAGAVIAAESHLPGPTRFLRTG